MPFDIFSEEVGYDIGMSIGRVVEVEDKGFTSDQARFIRIRVEIPLNKLLRRGSQFKNPEGEVGQEARNCDKPRDRIINMRSG